MPLGEDGGDVTYPYFLINGRTTKDPQVKDYRAGQRIRLRIINAGADTAFRVAVPGADLDVTHTDGYPVVPRRTESVILGMGERVDAIVTVGLVGAGDRRRGGQGRLRAAESASRRSAVANVDVDEFVKTLRTVRGAQYGDARRPHRKSFYRNAIRTSPWIYGWRVRSPATRGPSTASSTIRRTTGSRSRAGKRVRLRFVSESMMFHPMHLHGHTFQVVASPTVPGPARTRCSSRRSRPSRSTSTPTILAAGSCIATTTTTSAAGMATFVEYTG